MADNIKIVGNILNTSTVNRYSEEDIKLITSKKLQENFGDKEDYIEFYVYDAAENLLNTNYNYLSYKLPPGSNLTPGVNNPPNTTGNIQTTGVGIVSTLTTTGSLYPIIEIDPIKDLQDLGYSSGEFITKYNFFQSKISDYINEALFIKEISRDRTEVRLASTILTNEQIESGSLALISKINNTEDYYVDYLLNFGDNEQYVAVNVALNKDPDGYEILFKLYQPLPLDIQEKQTLWIVEEQVTPYIFNINLDKLIVPPPPPTLRGPNFDIEIEGQGTVSTAYNNYSGLISNLQSLQNSSYNQIQSLITSQSIDINVDYSNFNNFIFFGSAYQRVINFYNKVKEIEYYQTEINTLGPTISTTSSLQTTLNQYSASISNIISEFDGFEYYLYYNSGSSLTLPDKYSITPYPKSGSLLPYTLLSSTDSTVITWYNYALENALSYDRDNTDNLEFAIPVFIKDDTTNQPFLLFLNMVGHYFDNIWIYLKAVTDINLANNNLDYGISRDLVYQQLKSLGIKLYNSQAGDNVDGYLLGANTGSVLWNDDFSVTSSYLNNIPRKDLVAELYKRIYHNLPLLVKTKGTVAGLDHLMTTFGIPNRTYYAIGSESFYTPTGSAITASILNVKEFGGSLKSGLVDGYNNDKVRIVSNTITGSVLSPLLSLQTFPTASSEFRDDDLHYVDISFSPQTQIDTRTSLAITSNAPTWSLDDYIGDPSQLYSGSYSDLETQRTLYFETGVSGYPGFTSSLLDYNGFIRLIEFFDNSLFKMLNDFVPERTSLSTGVTINSPVLERNKAPYSKPTAATQSVYEANYDIASMSSQYGTFYNALSASNNTKAWYDGNISGSVVDINQYFEDNYNPYLGDWNVYNSQHTINEYINQNTFLHSDWNVLLNNVSESVDSQYRRRIEYFYGTTGSITYPAELQDSYLSLRSYNTSRYDGSKITSLLYNTYTSGSYTGSDGFTIQTGDKSFGKTAAIDLNVRKIGLFTRIDNSLFLSGKNNVALKYLVDEFGGLTELNQLNKHWEEIQNTFVAGDYTTVALFDNKKFGNQKFTDGVKPIFDSGYSYYPILYYSGSEGNSLYFESVGGTNAYFGRAYNLDSLNYFISGTASPGFPLKTTGSIRYVSTFFNNIVAGEQYLTGSTISAGSEFTVYNVQETGQYTINSTFDFNLTLLDLPPQSQSWAFQVWKSGSGGVEMIYEDAKTFIAGDPTNTTLALVGTFNYTGPYGAGNYEFNLIPAINSQQVKVRSALTAYYLDSDANILASLGTATQTGDAIFNPGDTTSQGVGSGPDPCSLQPTSTFPMNGNQLEIWTPFLGAWTPVVNGDSLPITEYTTASISISTINVPLLAYSCSP